MAREEVVFSDFAEFNFLGIDDIKNTIDESVRSEAMHSTFANPFHPKQIEREIIRNAEFMHEFNKKILPFDVSKARSSNQLEMNEDRFSHKKNKFLYQNAVLQEKIRDEEKMLLSKYCTKFGLNVQECKIFSYLLNY